MTHPKTRIDKTFETLGRPALISFITAGDPDRQTSQEALKALAENGADIIELGMPFTDPMADGPVIEAASQRALAAGANMKQTLEMVTTFRRDNQKTPLVLMGYFNPVMAYGIEKFAADSAKAGVDGLIIVDLPPEESAELETALEDKPINLIRLLTPTTDEKRLENLLGGAGGFLYYVSITGITGAASAKAADLKPHIDTIKNKTDLPVAIGFGVKTPENAAEMSTVADAVVVGSALVKTLNEEGIPALCKQVSALASALKT
ncbi:MAG: tryptophan synthase subunit alpha [Alphaproteobacteria bacterium]|nr:tryptophan synthase subunit alpha [Alphaproteobacteria bacterium]